ncbi:hypothetical protein [Ramlibacter sp. PS4R-6]|uniref:hypothetical protein n=1 Tax=Ramlibacter sp. PS4R-6 TaxID=3133438 RepID=UPI0030B426D8
MDDDKPKLDLPAGPFSGPDTFRDLVRAALAAANEQGWRELILCDPDFADWPLGERAVVESLGAWSQRGRRCILLARNWDEAVRRHARFVSWRRTWSHIIEAHACRSADPIEFPSAIWTPGWVLERRDLVQCRGWTGPEPDRRLTLREKINEWLGKSAPGFPSHTTGL